MSKNVRGFLFAALFGYVTGLAVELTDSVVTYDPDELLFAIIEAVLVLACILMFRRIRSGTYLA